jgi:hypothetical protein
MVPASSVVALDQGGKEPGEPAEHQGFEVALFLVGALADRWELFQAQELLYQAYG